MENILEIQNLSKKFDDTQALSNVNLTLKRGEIHGVIGANGSGKSTFMSILYGSDHIHKTGGYTGKILHNGKEIMHRNPIEALNNGFGMVHQEFALLGGLDVTSNIRINNESVRFSKGRRIDDRFSIVDRKKDDELSREALSKVGVEINPHIKVKNISVNMKQFVEIARETSRDNLDLLLLDEPTSSLNQEDTNLLLKSLRQIADDGVSIIFVSHRLDEVTALCDSVSVLRDGELVSNYSKEDFDIDKLSLDMIGMEIKQAKKTNPHSCKDTVIKFDNVSIIHGEKLYKDLSLDIKKGEVLGITGLAGHGQEVFAYGLMGLYQMQGDLYIDEEKVTIGDLESISKKGIYMLAEERKEMGILHNKALWENIVFNTYDKNPEFLCIPKLGGLSFLNHSNISRHCNAMTKKLNIKAASIDQAIKELSGGNQQKVCIARALTMNPHVLFVGEPTRGIDIYSKEIILDMLLDMNEKKDITLVISSGEVAELKRVCDRIVVMYEGEVFGIYDSDVDSKTLSLAILGRKNGSDK